jgi:hypothetical protein
MARKAKSAEPSKRDKLAAVFDEALEADAAENIKTVIEQLRTKSPDKYAELVADELLRLSRRNKGKVLQPTPRWKRLDADC